MADDNIWADYLDKMRRLEQAVKLVSFWTQETARQVEIVVKNVREYCEKTKARD